MNNRFKNGSPKIKLKRTPAIMSLSPYLKRMPPGNSIPAGWSSKANLWTIQAIQLSKQTTWWQMLLRT